MVMGTSLVANYHASWFTEGLGEETLKITFPDGWIAEFDTALYVNKKMKTDQAVAKQALAFALEKLKTVEDWSNDNLFAELKALAEEKGLKNGQIMYPVRIALSGRETTPGGATEIAVIIGKNETLRRIENALERL